MAPRTRKDPLGRWLNLPAFGYVFAGYAAAMYLLTRSGLVVPACGALLLAHTLVIAGYLVHELGHGTIFPAPATSARWGEALLWLTGGAYGSYESIVHKHFRHHADRADVVMFDFRPWLERHPRGLRAIRALEWAWVPAVDLVMHALVLVLPFMHRSRAADRARVLVVLASKITFFTVLAAVSTRALAFYALGYLVFLHVLRFMDVHQHTYEVWETLERPREQNEKRFDRAFEHRNTYSNLFSARWPSLNLLVLNFGYHNAHHVKPNVPWYRLPALHRELFGEESDRVLPIGLLLVSYHRHRVRRVTNGDPPDMDVRGQDFVGVVGVSFLTAH